MTDASPPRNESVLLFCTGLARGGAETQMVHLATTLRRRGWAVSVVSLAAPEAFQQDLREAGVLVDSPRMRAGRWSPFALLRLLVILRRLRPSLLHAHLFHANLLARLLRSLLGTRAVISTIHSLAESSRTSRDVKRRDWLYRITDSLANCTVCVSQAVAARYAEVKAVSARRLRVIPNGVDTQRFRPNRVSRARVREDLGVGDAFVWLAVGRLMWKKDYPTMLTAMARQRDAVLLIAGEGPQEDELRRQAAEQGVRARFLGLREDIPQLMNACDALVLSSVVEGLPMVLIEAAASGLPCVATDVGGVREVLREGETGFLVPPGDAGALASAMARLAAVPLTEREGMGRIARADARERFDIGAVTSQWEQLYCECLQRNDAGGAA